ncbi:hypothetical protein LguiA_000135 [Lonicera macranthoides]
MVLFYPNDYTSPSKPSQVSHKVLEQSLSETLTKYYPFAGRLVDSFTIDCNDNGIEYFEAQINCQLSQLLKELDGKNLNLLFPPHLLWKDTYKFSTDTLIGVQVTFFECGGMAISSCISHKLGDGGTMSSFLNDWATTARQSGTRGVPPPLPKFIAISIIPPPPGLEIVLPEVKFEQRKCVTRNYLFPASKIAKLKALAVELGVHKPTRAEVVTALLYKCTMAANASNSGTFKQSVLVQLVDMRSRVVPPLPRNSVGNFSWFFAISPDESEMKLEELVGQLKNGIAHSCGENMSVDDWLLSAIESTKEAKMMLDADVYRFSIVRGTSLYQVDFGWGKPVSVRMPNGVVKNTFVLIDSKDGVGIEASVTLEEQDMDVFERDQELLKFASSIPVALPVKSKL